MNSRYDDQWLDDYRRAVAFNALGMLTATNFRSVQEQTACQELLGKSRKPADQEGLELMLSKGREQELLAALAEHRNPHFVYPLIPLNEIQERIKTLLNLEQRIHQQERNEIVRGLYVGNQLKEQMGAIPYHLHYLQLIEATARGDSEAFWQHNLAINPLPSPIEMQYVFSRVKWFIEQGRQYSQTRPISDKLSRFFEEQLSLPLNTVPDTSAIKGPPLDTSLYGKSVSVSAPRTISPEAVRLFFSSLFRDHNCFDWDVRIDYAALTTRLEPGLRHYVLAGGLRYTLSKVVELVAHEWFAHISPRILGDRSSLGLLGIGTGESLSTEEGAALYYEWEMAKRLGKRFDETRIWLDTLTIALAAGVLVPPQDFFSLCTFIEEFLVLYRLIWRGDETVTAARERARVIARNCYLRIERGVPPQSRAGICYTKGAHYTRGFFKVCQAVEQDATILDWLASGVVALEQIPDLQALGMSPATDVRRTLLERPDLEEYIQSFEGDISS